MSEVSGDDEGGELGQQILPQHLPHCRLNVGAGDVAGTQTDLVLSSPSDVITPAALTAAEERLGGL